MTDSEGLPIAPTGKPGLVSVILPTYNRGYCVANAITGALAQTYADLEVIVIDDGSKDNTQEVITSAFGAEPRVRYIQQANGGVAVARNHGIRQARGEFIALLDSDDIWKPWKTEIQVSVLRERPEAGMVWTDMEAVDPEGKPIAPRYLRTMYAAYRWFPRYEELFTASYPVQKLDGARLYVGDISSPMMVGNLVHTSTVLIRRERLARTGFFPEYLRNAGEDYDYHLRTCYEGPVAFVDVASIYYRVGWHDQITVRDYDFFFARGYLKSIRRYLHADQTRVRLPKWMVERILAQGYGWVGTALHARGRRKMARRFLMESCRHRLWQPRVFLALFRVTIPRWFDVLALSGYRAAKRMLGLAPSAARG